MSGRALAAQAGWRKVGPAVTATMAKVPEAAQSLRDPKTVLHVSSAHRVSDGRIAFKDAPALCAAGYDVTVLGLHSADGMPLPTGPRSVQHRKSVVQGKDVSVRVIPRGCRFLTKKK